MRVHELAKAVGLESKEVLAIAKKHRVALKASPSANVEDKDVRKLMPHIDKFKSELVKKAEDDKRRKDEERRRKDEERRLKEAERRKELEAKRLAEEEERRKREEEVRLRADEERRQREAEETRKRSEETRKRTEDEKAQREMVERMKAAGLRVPAGMKPGVLPPAAPTPQAPPQRPPQQPRTPTTGRPEFQNRDRGAAGPGGYTRTPGGPARGPGGPGRGPGGPGGPGRGPGGPGGPARGPGGPGRGPGQGQGTGQSARPGGTGGYQGRSGPGQGGRPGGGTGAPGQRPQRPYPGGGTGQPRQDRGQRPDGRPQRDSDKTGPVNLTESNLPQIGVMRDKPASRHGRDKDKKTAAAKDKARVNDRRKPKPSRIFELDEDMTITSRPKPGVRPGMGPGVRRGAGGRGVRRDPAAPRTYGSSVESSAERPRRAVRLEGPVTLSQFAQKIGVASNHLLKQLLLVGELVTLNHTLTEEQLELLAADFNVELTIVRENDENDVAEYLPAENPDILLRRPPVVTIMGHVDHGKTTLLDRIRKSNVVDGEFGGITQHIGAYLVSTAKGDIVFLDTPGHEAFTAMRARGAGVTDLVILVVGADDGFMPQTIEAANHAQAAKVPILVAVNKIDLPQADPAKIRQQALQHNLVPEEFGGDTMFVDISAKHSKNLDQLLELVALQAEVLDLKAAPDRPAQGIIIESHVDPLRGAVATVLVQSGTLRHGDAFVVGNISGRVRAMNDDHGRPITEAGPAFPVEIIGLEGSPSAGELFTAMPDEKIAREVAERRQVRRRAAGIVPAKKHISLEGLGEFIAEGLVKELNVIVKGDVQGSLEAVQQSLAKMGTEQVRIRVIHAAVGGINESDVNLAAASDAIIIGFNVRPEPSAADLADHEGVDIRTYRIIYDLIEDLRKALTGILDPKFEERVLGHAEVRQLFRISRLGTIAGCYVTDGEMVRDAKIRLLRDSVVVYEGSLSSLKRFKDDVKKVASNTECGLSIENFNDLKEGDVIEAYTMDQVAVALD